MKTISPKLKITIGIPAYNEQSNIDCLLRAVLSQHYIGFELSRIIVSSDGSTDDTVKRARSIRDKRLIVIANEDRQGIARGLNQIISHTHSDILVTLDADIKINDCKFMYKLIRPVIDNIADLTSSGIAELPPKSHLGRILHISMQLKRNLFSQIKHGNNIYTCHGLARAYSRKLYKKLRFPVSIGNDMYSYLTCLDMGLKFRFVKDAIAWYRLPENLADHEKQSLRFYKSVDGQTKYFSPEFVKNETRIPFTAYLNGAIMSFSISLNYPLDLIKYIILQNKLKLMSKLVHIPQAWEISTSSKRL